MSTLSPLLALAACSILCSSMAGAAPGADFATGKEGIVGTYRKSVPEEPFETVKARDEKDKPRVLQRQRELLAERYDLADRPSKMKMAGGSKSVQEGVRIKLPPGMTWEKLSQMTPEEIRAADAFPRASYPCRMSSTRPGDRYFRSSRSTRSTSGNTARSKGSTSTSTSQTTCCREFPPPIFLTTRPELGDVSKGQVLTTKNFFQLMNGLLTPVQMEGLRLLLTPFPQEEFNQTDDRKVPEPQFGVACLDCHELPHQRGLSSESGHPAPGPALQTRHDQPAWTVQSADPRFQALIALRGGLHRVRAAHSVLQW